MASDWEGVLDVQLDLHNFLTSDKGLQFGAGWFESTYEAHKDEPAEAEFLWGSVDEARRNGAAWAMQTGVSAFNAEPIWVDPDMMTLVEAAAASFRPEPLHEEDLITREGLLVLPRPMWIGVAPGREGTDARLNWSIAHWKVNNSSYVTGQPKSVRGPGIMLVLYHDQSEPDELDKREGGAWTTKALGSRWVPTHCVNWAFGENHPTYTNKQITDRVAGQYSIMGAHDVQLQTQAIWRLLNQTIAVKEKHRPGRSYWKRAQKAKLPSEHVTVVRLRRPTNPPSGNEPETVNWTHRWIVGGHWRWQWYRDDHMEGHCGHLDNDGLVCMATGGRHKQIWISPYSKGPADLPLIINKARVFVLER